MSNDKYTVPEYPVSRVRYYSGQFLKEEDFIAEQSYHIAHQRRHDRLLHGFGVIEGLAVTLVNNGTAIEVTQGSALDGEGRQILSAAKQTITLDPTLTGTAWVEIAFAEVESHPADQNSTVQSNTRFSQNDAPISISRAKTPGAVTLATLSIAAGAATLSFAERVNAGLRLPGPADATGGGYLRSRGDATPGWAELGCSLSVTGNAALTGTLGVSGASTLASASVTGALGVAGAATFATAGVTGGFSVNGMSWLSAVNVTGAFAVNGQTALLGTNVNGTLGVTGLSTLASASVTGTLGVNGLTTLANASVTGTLGVTGLATLSSASVTGTLGVTGLATLGNATVTGALGVNGLATLGSASVTGALGVNGLATISAASVTGALGVNGLATIAAASVTGALGVNGLATIAAASVTGAFGVNGLSTLSNTTVNGTLGVTGLLTLNTGISVIGGAVTLAGLAPSQAVFTNANRQLSTGTLSVSMGGTGATALTGVLKGNGAGAFSAMTGATNQLARWTDANTIAASPMITDNGGSVGIGMPTPQAHLHVGGVNVITRIESGGSGGWAELDLYSSYPVADQRYWNIAACGFGGLQIRQLTDVRGLRSIPLNIDTNGNVGINIGGAQPRGRLDLGLGGLGANLRIGDYLDIGETGHNTAVYMGINAVLSTSSYPPGNRFRPVHAPGTGMVLAEAGGGAGDLDFWGINWAGNAAEQDFPNAFTHVMRLGIDGKVGITTGGIAPRTALDTGSGLLSGAANDYTKAQFTLSGGGKVTWAGNRLKWSNRFIAICAEKSRTMSIGYVDIWMPPTGTIPAAQMSDGVARSVDANGILLNGWEALYAVHTVGGNSLAVQLRVQSYLHDFHAPSNWILIAVVNGDDNSVKLGTGVVLTSNSSASKGAGVPSGTIVMWYGDASTIPDGWAICNGSNGTPNLVDRFVVGAGSAYAYAATGGEATHTLTVNEMPVHAHLALGSGADDGNFSGGNIYNGERIPFARSDANVATLETTRNAGGGAAHENRPPYYALYYIMKL